MPVEITKQNTDGTRNTTEVRGTEWKIGDLVVISDEPEKTTITLNCDTATMMASENTNGGIAELKSVGNFATIVPKDNNSEIKSVTVCRT